MNMYKVGDWLKNKHTSHLVEIVEVITSPDGRHEYVVKKPDKELMYTQRVNYSILLEHYDFLPLARLLYHKKVSSEVIK